jgi:phosphoribosylformimino-5-aminoimidazole carboxamide ribotide isomerase
MNTKIYPAIDIIDGKCVRLSQGDYDAKTVYHNEPIKVALDFWQNGAEYIHIVDLDAAKNPKESNRKIIGDIIKNSDLKVQTGGGIRTQEDVESLLELGADRLIIGSTAVSSPESVQSWGDQYGWDHIVIGADISQNKIATHGWKQITNIDISDFIDSFMKFGAKNFLITEISKDGMLSGSAWDLYSKLLYDFPELGLVASGGVHDYQEVDRLQNLGVESIIIGKALYEGKIDLAKLFSGRHKN